MLFCGPVSGGGAALHSSHCVLSPAVSVRIGEHDVDCTHVMHVYSTYIFS